MKINSARYLIAALAGLITVLAACGGGSATPAPTDETREASYGLAAGARLTLRAENGSVVVRKSATERLTLTSTLHRPAGIQYFVLPTGNEPHQELLISAMLRPGGPGNASSEFTLAVPDGITLTINTTNGTVDVNGVALGDTALNTTNASVTVSASKADFTINTSNGKLTVGESEGTFWTQTTNSPVEISGVVLPGRSNRFKTTNSPITVSLRGSPDLKVTVNVAGGNADVTGAEPAGQSGGFPVYRYGVGSGSLEIETTNGDVKVALGSGPGPG